LLKRIREFALGHSQYPLIGITGLTGSRAQDSRFITGQNRTIIDAAITAIRQNTTSVARHEAATVN
jgi:hypothetical protein